MIFYILKHYNFKWCWYTYNFRHEFNWDW